MRSIVHPDKPIAGIRFADLPARLPSLRLDDTMKERITAAADQAGKSAYAFILDAIAQTVEQVD
jgi:uncharacterized protein (DUF1778 family)